MENVEKLTVAQLVKHFPPFMEHKGSLPNSQKPATDQLAKVKQSNRQYISLRPNSPKQRVRQPFRNKVPADKFREIHFCSVCLLAANDRQQLHSAEPNFLQMVKGRTLKDHVPSTPISEEKGQIFSRI
jgi:hypothetical protein